MDVWMQARGVEGGGCGCAEGWGVGGGEGVERGRCMGRPTVHGSTKSMLDGHAVQKLLYKGSSPPVLQFACIKAFSFLLARRHAPPHAQKRCRTRHIPHL